MDDLSQLIENLPPDKHALLEAWLLELSRVPNEDDTIPRRPAGPCSLSFAQQRMWFLAQLEPNNPFYNVPWAVRVRGSVNLEALREALKAFVARHEVLRTVFISQAGTPVQEVTDNELVDIPSSICDPSPPHSVRRNFGDCLEMKRGVRLISRAI